MTDLTTQIEQAGPEQQREMLDAAWLRIYERPSVQSERGRVYHRLLSVNTDEAFTGAALMLVPEGWCIAIRQQDKGWAVDFQKGYRTSYTDVILTKGGGKRGWPATPALAIAAVCVRAHDKEAKP
ncbi:MAG: hypothetical protein NUV75_00550 [Gallionella sp.]|nr:hypothetical protein [Gallionella sp.]